MIWGVPMMRTRLSVPGLGIATLFAVAFVLIVSRPDSIGSTAPSQPASLDPSTRPSSEPLEPAPSIQASDCSVIAWQDNVMAFTLKATTAGLGGDPGDVARVWPVPMEHARRRASKRFSTRGAVRIDTPANLGDIEVIAGSWICCWPPRLTEEQWVATNGVIPLQPISRKVLNICSSSRTASIWLGSGRRA